MREFKFRAWDIDGRKMIYGDVARDTIPLAEANPKTIFVMQYTGLKDKNGKKIYEGDITNCGVVEWNDHLNWDSGGSNHPGFYFKDKYEYGESGALSYHDGFDESIEVIGNIYENPELLENK